MREYEIIQEREHNGAYEPNKAIRTIFAVHF